MWVSPNYEKSKLNEDWKTHPIIIKKINRFLFIILCRKLKDIFHWYTYICCHLSPIHYYSFSAGSKTSSLFCRPGLTSNVILLPFFGGGGIRPVGKHRSRSSIWPGPLENSCLFLQPIPASWKNHLIYRPVGRITQKDEHRLGKMYFWRLKWILLFSGKKKFGGAAGNMQYLLWFKNKTKQKPDSVPDKLSPFIHSCCL